MKRINLPCLAIISAISVSPAFGHEYWIDPHSYQVEPGEKIIADIRVGQNFEGPSFPYIPPNFRLFELAQGKARREVEGRFGDRPAMSQAAEVAGLAVVLHVTTDSRRAYKEFEEFQTFVEHKDASWTLAAHRERGLPNEGFAELYTRYAKSLVAVGDGAGQDLAYGLETEIVALDNPYVDDVSDGVNISVLYKGAPRGSAQVEVFEKAPGGSISVSTTHTDANGMATVPVKPGHRYMLDAVVLREPAADTAAAHNVVWESLWANLTFAVPGE